MATHGGVDVLVNCAGIQHVAPVEDFDEERWDTIIALMLTAPFLLTKHAWPVMRARGGGRIVNVASIHRSSRHRPRARTWRPSTGWWA